MPHSVCMYVCKSSMCNSSKQVHFVYQCHTFAFRKKDSLASSVKNWIVSVLPNNLCQRMGCMPPSFCHNFQVLTN